MVTESNIPKYILDFFSDEGVPIFLVHDNPKMQKSKKCNECMKLFWVKDIFLNLTMDIIIYLKETWESGNMILQRS